jgi:signal transduction histidine kinase
LVVPLQDGGTVIGTFLVIADETRSAAERERVLRLALGEALVALLAGSAAGYLLLRRLLGTVGRITRTAAGLGRGEMDGRLGDQTRADEVGELAATFDDMADRVAAAMDAQRRLLADVSHQLRTPLTVARGHLEVLQRTGREDPVEVDQTVSLVVDELDHMRRLVERLLLLGAAMEPDFLEPEPIELRSLLADVQESSRVLGDRRWLVDDVPELVIVGDPGKLRGALLNLTDNATRATAVGGIVEIGAGRLSDGGVELHVADDGPGIPSAQRLAAMERFRRPGGADRGSGGLGLSIVKAVAEAHGGTMEIGESCYGGCLVRIVLPAGVVHPGRG